MAILGLLDCWRRHSIERQLEKQSLNEGDRQAPLSYKCASVLLIMKEATYVVLIKQPRGPLRKYMDTPLE